MKRRHSGSDSDKENSDHQNQFFKCHHCSLDFYDQKSLSDHLHEKHNFVYQCKLCSYNTNSITQYSQHCQQEHHNNCYIDIDEELISNIENVNHEEAVEETFEPKKYKNINKNLYRIKAWSYKGGGGGNDDLHSTLDNLKENIKQDLISFSREKISAPSLKFLITVDVEFAKMVDARERRWTTTHVYFNSKLQTLFDVNMNFDEAYNQSVAQIWKSCDKFIQNGSGWVFRRICQVKLSIFRYQAFKGSSYIPTPLPIKRKKCLINIKNTDDACFKWSILAHKYRNKVNKNSKFLSSIYNRKDWVDSINWEGIQFPTPLSDLDIFEKNNPDWGVNVLQVNTSSEVIPTMIRKSQFYYSRKIPVNLLLIVDEESGIQHYTLVTNEHSLCKTNFTNSSKVCFNCMTTFGIRTTKDGKEKDELRYQEHVKACTQKDLTKFTFPTNKKMKFRNIGHIKRNEFNIIADFECMMTEGPKVEKDENCEAFETVNILAQHKVFAVGMYVVSDRYQDQFKPQKYREGIDGNENAGYMFCKMLHENMEKIEYLYDTECNKAMTPLTVEEEKEFQKSNICHICDEAITCKFSYPKWLSLMQNNILSDDPKEKDKLYVDSLTLKGPKICDHDHWDSFYRGPAHSSCNLLFRERGKSMKTNVFLHNGGKYDFHLILQNLFKFMEDNADADVLYKPQVIAKTLENFMQIQVRSNTVIKDSLNFLGSGLDKLVNNLKDEAVKTGNLKGTFKHTYTYFEQLCRKNPFLKEEHFHLLTRKGIYPYQYITSLEKCKEPSLPSIEHFYSDLTGESISEIDYAHGKKVFEVFQCSDLGDYTDLYVLLDTLLLTDCLEAFRKNTYKNFKLDPVYYTSTPSLSLDCALKYTKSEFEILDTIEKVDFIDGAIIGGYSSAHECLVRSNNKFIPKYYDPQKPNSYNFYFDVINLYGSKLRGLNPYGGFEIMKEKDIEKFTEEYIKDIPDNALEGYFIKCDLDYPHHLHNSLAHMTLPLVPCHLEIKPEMLSEYQRATSENLTNKIGGVKVCTSLFDKKNVTLHYVNLKQALNLGLKLRKVHGIMKFKQGYKLRSYIDFCTEMRKQSKNNFEKDFWKLCINSLFGKLCENLKLRRDVKIVSTSQDLMKYVRKPLFERGTIYDEERFAGIELRKGRICLNKPRYVGAAVLSLSKTVLYDFHYNFIFKHFPNTLLSFTDTDSLFYNITTDYDIYKLLYESNLIDFSNYPKSSPYYNCNLKGIPGKWKDELAGLAAIECVALRSKMYSIEYNNDDDDYSDKIQNKKVAKGITRAYQKNFITHDQYLECLESNDVKKCWQTNITSRDHKLYTTKFVKSGLSGWNDKRLIYRDMESKEFFCLPLGHYLSQKNLNDEEVIKSLKCLPYMNKRKRKNQYQNIERVEKRFKSNST